MSELYVNCSLTQVGVATSILKSKLELQKVFEGVVVSDFEFDGGCAISINPQVKIRTAKSV